MKSENLNQKEPRTSRRRFVIHLKDMLESKVDLTHVPPDAIFAIANALERGAEQHGVGVRGTEEGNPFWLWPGAEKRYTKILRHLLKLRLGSWADVDDNVHLEAIITQATLWLAEMRTGQDADREPGSLDPIIVGDYDDEPEEPILYRCQSCGQVARVKGVGVDAEGDRAVRYSRCLNCGLVQSKVTQTPDTDSDDEPEDPIRYPCPTCGWLACVKGHLVDECGGRSGIAYTRCLQCGEVRLVKQQTSDGPGTDYEYPQSDDV